MFKAYLDESVTVDQRVLSVGAYLATADRWDLFQHEWQTLLDQAGVAVFHMTDFEARRPPYDTWDRVKRIGFLRALLATIKARTCLRVSVSVSIPDYDELAAHLRQAYGPYGFCAFQCLQYVRRWADDNNLPDPIAYFFEQSPREGEIVRAMQHLQGHIDLIGAFRFYSYGFVPKTCQPVQASDILAYETAKHVRNWFVLPSAERRRTRLSLETLMESSHYGTYYDRARLAVWLTDFERFRPGGATV